MTDPGSPREAKPRFRRTGPSPLIIDFGVARFPGAPVRHRDPRAVDWQWLRLSLYSPPVMQGLLTGETLEGKYAIDRLLGQGGMGVVYAGEHVVLHRQVAIKVLHPFAADDPAVIARFEAEARAAAGIRHRNVVEVTDFGLTPDRRPFFVMELLIGESLADRLDSRIYLSEREAIDISDQILCGLGSAHRRGIVHRDLKPENIFLARDDDDRLVVKILDFGIAKILGGIAPGPFGIDGDPSRPITDAGVALGTPGYMAPETVSGRGQVDARADLFSLGVLLFEMLTGRRPFRGETPHDVIVATVSSPVPRPSSLRSDISPALERLILTALAKDPNSRYRDSDEFLRALTAAAVGRVDDGARPCRTTTDQSDIHPGPPTAALHDEPRFPATSSGSGRPPVQRSAAPPPRRRAPLRNRRFSPPISPLWILFVVGLLAAAWYFFFYQQPLQATDVIPP
jgi:serine/threonine-protein kinase